ncbi:MAG: PQQ-binding-like beta-propeller repeat protein [Armatimonadetes bacterium]|nr:PQQ-binding-like beta-propeller repeat protein [Armatimonadota bacterium]
MRTSSRFIGRTGVVTVSFLLGTAPLMAQNAALVGASNGVSWTTFKGDFSRTGSSAANITLPLSLQWRFSSEAPARTYPTSALVLGAPGQQRVFFAAGRNVYCLDTQTGQQIWQSPTFNSSVITPITALSGEGGDLILAAQQGGRLAALRATDGGRAWEGDVRSTINNAGPIVVNTPRGQRILTAANSGRIVAFTLDGTVDPEWKASLGRTSPSTPMALSNDGSLLFIGGSDSKLYVIDIQKGVVAYTIQLRGTSLVSPVVAGDQVITSSRRRLASYRVAGGSAAWTFDTTGLLIASPAVAKDAAGKNVLYVGTRDGSFYALDEAGKQIWKTSVGVGITGTPLALPTMVLVGTSNGLFLALDRATGRVLWEYRLKTERVVAQAAQSVGNVNVGAEGGPPVDAAQTEPQTRIWSVSAAPSAVNGQLFLLGDNAALYGFTTRSFDALPPRVIEPSLAVPDDRNKISSLLLSPATPLVVPGQGPIYFAAQMEDTGSGIDPASIQASLDNVAIAPDAVNFRSGTGILTLTLLDPAKGGTTLSDGLRNLTITARDYAGNQLRYSIGFLIDNTAPPPVSTEPEPTPQEDLPVDNGGDMGGGDAGGGQQF